MKNKFTMPLTWHNCHSCPPEELSNSYLLATDGSYVYSMSWRKGNGYLIATQLGVRGIRASELENWWWADIEQTVKECLEFKKEREL
jgi:hypothetical protein